LTDEVSSPKADTQGAAILRRWRDQLRAPVIGAPMFLASGVELVIAQCTNGIIGTIPALNARPSAQFDDWLFEIEAALAEWDRDHAETPAAPFGVNLIVHKSNPRLEEDLALCVAHKVPLVISSMGAREDVNQAVQAYGGVTLHDVTTQAPARQARRADCFGWRDWYRPRGRGGADDGSGFCLYRIGLFGYGGSAYFDGAEGRSSRSDGGRHSLYSSVQRHARQLSALLDFGDGA
jgi:hypothetical protein